MMNIGAIELGGRINSKPLPAVNTQRSNPILRIIGKNGKRQSQPSVVNDDIPAAFDRDIESDVDEDSTIEALRVEFVSALTAHCKALIPLTDVVTRMIGADVERETAIEWGIEAGLSESYVRSTVSSLYIQITGMRVKRVGGGRKRNDSAAGFAELAMKACKDDVSEAKALLLAARRLLEAWEKAGTVEQELAKIRA